MPLSTDTIQLSIQPPVIVLHESPATKALTPEPLRKTP